MRRLLIALLLLALPVQAGQTTRFTLPAERARGVTWADDFRSQDSCEDNGGTVIGAPTFSITEGVTLDGTNDAIQYDFLGHELNSDPLTILITFYPDNAYDEDAERWFFSDDGNDYSLRKQNNAGSDVLSLRLGGTAIGDIAAATYGSYWSQGGRNQILISSTSGDTDVYLNNVLVMDSDATAWTPAEETIFNVGASSAPDDEFDGRISKFKIFHAKLTADEAEDYWTHSTFDYLDGATAVYQMRTEDHDAGNHQTLDSTGNGNHLTLGDGAGTGEPTKITSKDGYSFDGADDYFDDFPAATDTETIMYAWDGADFISMDSESGRSVIGSLETSGDFEGEIYWLGIFPQALTQTQKYDLAIKLRRSTYAVPGQTILYTDQSTLDTTTLEIACTAGKSATVHWGDGESTAWTCDGARNSVDHDYATEGQYAIRLVGDLLDVTKIKCIETHVYGDISNVSGLTSLTFLYLYNTSVDGDISNVSGLTSLTFLNLAYTSVDGDISNVSGLTSLTYLSLGSTSVDGDISNVSGLTSLIHLYLGNTSVDGDISNVSGLTSLTYLHLGNTSVDGDISNVSGLTSLTTLYLYNTSVTGNLASIRPLTSLTICYLYNTSLTYTSAGALPAWPGANLDLYSCGLDSGEVDAFLNDFDDDLTGAAGDLRLDGTNANRTAASDAACTAITTDGWGLHVNPDYP